MDAVVIKPLDSFQWQAGLLASVAAGHATAHLSVEEALETAISETVGEPTSSGRFVVGCHPAIVWGPCRTRMEARLTKAGVEVEFVTAEVEHVVLGRLP